MDPAAIRRGDVFWAPPEVLRPTIEGHRHPHVVVQADVLNQSRIPTVVVCALSTNLQKMHEPGNVLLDEGEGALPQRSVVVVSQVSTVDKVHLGPYVGTLTEARVEQILDGLRFQQRTYFER